MLIRVGFVWIIFPAFLSYANTRIRFVLFRFWVFKSLQSKQTLKVTLNIAGGSAPIATVTDKHTQSTGAGTGHKYAQHWHWASSIRSKRVQRCAPTGRSSSSVREWVRERSLSHRLPDKGHLGESDTNKYMWPYVRVQKRAYGTGAPSEKHTKNKHESYSLMCATAIYPLDQNYFLYTVPLNWIGLTFFLGKKGSISVIRTAIEEK